MPGSRSLQHIAGQPVFGRAAYSVIPESAFAGAYAEITQWRGYEPTPLYSLNAIASDLGVAAVHYKHEGPRFGLGSFKALGGAYAAEHVLQRQIGRRLGQDISLDEIRRGDRAAEAASIVLASATDGNHGRSLAWGCRRFGASCRIYIHAHVSAGREKAMKALGADVVRISGDYDDAVAQCRDDADANGWFVVSDTSWSGYVDTPRDVMAGYGVMIREVFDELDEPPTHVFVQGGVGGLAASTAAALRQLWGEASPRVVVVEPDRAACLLESAVRGRLTAVAIETETIMAGLSCGEPSPLAWEVLSSEVSDYIAISDSLVPGAVRRLAMPTGPDPVIEAGESAVAGLAALLELNGMASLRETLQLTSDARILLIGSEGVTDPEIFAAIMAGGDAVPA
jgi:diaminopropionate ammonia-lyase